MKIFATLLVAAIAAGGANAQDSSKRHPMSSPGGRFVLGQIGDSSTSQYLLDTQTGRVWDLVNILDSKGQITATRLRQMKFVTEEGVVWGPEPPPMLSK